MLRRIRRKLNLNSQQQKKLAQLTQQLEDFKHNYHNSHHRRLVDLQALLDETRFNHEQAADLLQTQINRIERCAHDCITRFGEFADSLEPVQRQRLKATLGTKICLRNNKTC